MIKSYLPFEGRVDIHCRSDRRIRLRVPDYVRAESLSIEMNSQRSQGRKHRDWLQLPPTREGDVAVVRFELLKRDAIPLGLTSLGVDQTHFPSLDPKVDPIPHEREDIGDGGNPSP